MVLPHPCPTPARNLTIHGEGPAKPPANLAHETSHITSAGLQVLTAHLFRHILRLTSSSRSPASPSPGVARLERILFPVQGYSLHPFSRVYMIPVCTSTAHHHIYVMFYCLTVPFGVSREVTFHSTRNSYPSYTCRQAPERGADKRTLPSERGHLRHDRKSAPGWNQTSGAEAEI